MIYSTLSEQLNNMRNAFLFMLLLGVSGKGFALSLDKTAQGYFYSSTDQSEMVEIPAGVYSLGDSQGRYDERPQLSVRLHAFLIDRREVSNIQFQRFVQQSGYSPQGPWKEGFPTGGERLPVRLITWYDAQAYAKWAGKQLPTETQWEAAAGKNIFPWGDTWQMGRSITDQPVEAGPQEVDLSLERHPLGILNLAGNVREWVATWYDRYAYQTLANLPIIEDPQGPMDHTPPEQRFIDAQLTAGNERSTRKVVKGASWVAHHPDWVRKSHRGAHNPHHWYNDLGFRCVFNLEEP